VVAYRKFSDTLRMGAAIPTPPKPPNAPKIVSAAEIKDHTLGGLGALGGGRAEKFRTASETWMPPHRPLTLAGSVSRMPR
jgi:hypothetical protein